DEHDVEITVKAGLLEAIIEQDDRAPILPERAPVATPAAAARTLVDDYSRYGPAKRFAFFVQSRISCGRSIAMGNHNGMEPRFDESLCDPADRRRFPRTAGCEIAH